MALEFRKEHVALSAGGARVVVDRHLYLTEDKDRVVEEGDPAGRWLWATPGMEVPRVEAERLGAIRKTEPEATVAEQPVDEPAPDEEPVVEVPEDEAEAEEKQAPSPPNKARKAPVRNKQT